MVRKEFHKTVNQNMRGGKGEVTIEFILNPEELLGHGRMFAKAILPSGSSIGRHEHLGEFEAYYVLKGEATFVDNDGKTYTLKAGELGNIECNQAHSVANDGTETMEMICLILNERGVNK
ncbi:Oxalate-binding protein [bioreactor metagenome]|uniref:Oxalate-binding protein n=1 Tax=bioreactor metagenome TaxID=1076179 RepID=A0A645B2A0_9ZZZZ